MIPADSIERRREAADELQAREQRQDGQQVVNGLCYGLTTLRNVLFTRIHQDVEKNVGRDSMMMPVSLLDSEEKAKLEIEIFQVAVSAVEVKQRAYVRDPSWYLDWLSKLRLGDSAAQSPCQVRLARYQAMTSEERRLGFSRVLEKTFPEAVRAPLILYRLFPTAVSIATALAFHDTQAATELRNLQTSWLPAIRDCHECRGRPLDNGEQCTACGNPVWSYSWLTAAD